MPSCEWQPDLVLNVLDAHKPHRFKVSTEGPGMGWSAVSSFRVFASPVPGAAKFYILDAHEPHRFKVRGGEAFTLIS